MVHPNRLGATHRSRPVVEAMCQLYDVGYQATWVITTTVGMGLLFYRKLVGRVDLFVESPHEGAADEVGRLGI